jgi:hypothetical protein
MKAANSPRGHDPMTDEQSADIKNLSGKQHKYGTLCTKLGQHPTGR